MQFEGDKFDLGWVLGTEASLPNGDNTTEKIYVAVEDKGKRNIIQLTKSPAIDNYISLFDPATGYSASLGPESAIADVIEVGKPYSFRISYAHQKKNYPVGKVVGIVAISGQEQDEAALIKLTGGGGRTTDLNQQFSTFADASIDSRHHGKPGMELSPFQIVKTELGQPVVEGSSKIVGTQPLDTSARK